MWEQARSHTGYVFVFSRQVLIQNPRTHQHQHLGALAHHCPQYPPKVKAIQWSQSWTQWVAAWLMAQPIIGGQT